MARKKDNAEQPNWKELMWGDSDGMRPLLREVVQQVLEAEMDESLGVLVICCSRFCTTWITSGMELGFASPWCFHSCWFVTSSDGAPGAWRCATNLYHWRTW